jgi:hypothetical protein
MSWTLEQENEVLQGIGIRKVLLEDGRSRNRSLVV